MRTRPFVLLLAAAFVLSGCGKVIRGTVDALGIDRGGSSAPDPGDQGAPTASVITLIRGTHRTIEGAGPVVVAIVRRFPTDVAVTIDFRSADGDGPDLARAGDDYRPVAGTLSWGPNEWEPKFISVEVFRDTRAESTETFQLEFSNVRGAQSELSAITCYIDDPAAIPLLAADVETISARTGGSQRLWLRAGREHAGMEYMIAGSLGTTPGFMLGEIHVPLNIDPWFELTLGLANTANLHATAGKLGSTGEAFAELRAPPIPIAAVVGVQVHHAYIVHDGAGGIRLASNPVALKIVE